MAPFPYDAGEYRGSAIGKWGGGVIEPSFVSSLSKLRQHDVARRHVGDDFEGAAQGTDDPAEGADLHVGLVFHFGESRLGDAEGISDFLLRQAGMLAEFAQQHLGLHFLQGASERARWAGVILSLSSEKFLCPAIRSVLRS